MGGAVAAAAVAAAAVVAAAAAACQLAYAAAAAASQIFNWAHFSSRDKNSRAARIFQRGDNARDGRTKKVSL